MRFSILTLARVLLGPIRLVAPLLLVACLVAGCGSDDDAGPCDERSGTYLARYTERSGNCGPIPEQLGTITKQPDYPPAPCIGEIEYYDQNCEVVFHQTCPEDGLGEGWESRAEGKVNWNKDGSRGTGVMQFVVRDENDAIQCQGTYDVVSERI